MEVLSEHNCHGWLEGYTLTGRHGMFATYEAFAMVSASQTIQHGKWLQEAENLPWRAKVPSLNILLTSTAWRNDHNGFSHQGPGLIQNVLTQRGNVARVYLPPDANCLLSVADHCLRSRSYINLIVIDKQPQLQYLTMDEAIEHCARGAGVWDWAGTDDGISDPDIVLACAGDVVTMETVAAAEILRERLPALPDPGGQRRRPDDPVRPQGPPARHGRDPVHASCSPTRRRRLRLPRLPGRDPPARARPPGRRPVPGARLHRGGHTTTPFDMTVRNRASRYHLVMDAINNARRTPPGASDLKAWCERQLAEHESYVVEHLEDMPEVRDWVLDRLRPPRPDGRMACRPRRSVLVLNSGSSSVKLALLDPATGRPDGDRPWPSGSAPAGRACASGAASGDARPARRRTARTAAVDRRTCSAATR